MLQHRVSRATGFCAVLCLFALEIDAARAADLEAVPPPALREQVPLVWHDNGEFVPAHHGCRLIPQPHLNLWGETTSFIPTWVCVSRGLYADTFPPPPPPPKFLGLW
jgi:hypothetical protein